MSRSVVVVCCAVLQAAVWCRKSGMRWCLNPADVQSLPGNPAGRLLSQRKVAGRRDGC